jgi:hypothetical protein
MKRLTVFETGIIGFFIGVTVSAYLTFLTSTGGFVGDLLSWISLRPIFESLGVPDAYLLVGSFVFFILVYTVYGIIVGALIQKMSRSRIMVGAAALVLFVTAATFDQRLGVSTMPAISDNTFVQSAAVVRAVPKSQQKYFGDEAVGDLNGDNEDDVAFLINRKDDERGVLYYLVAALATSTGRTGTNLIFLGDKVIPQNITIIDRTIIIDTVAGPSVELERFYAQVIGGDLQKVASSSMATTSDSAL